MGKGAVRRKTVSRNPYRVLGVSPTDDDETIKRSYRELARKYHPDRYRDSDLADLAGEKMSEINAAYEEIMHERSGGAPAGGNTRDTADRGPRRPYEGEYREPGDNAWRDERGTREERRERRRHREEPPHDFGGADASYNAQNYSAEARSKFTLIRNCINSGNISEAERLLDEVDAADRGAEWVFLTGCVQLRKGFYVDAEHSFEEAYRMEPTNNEYWTFKERMHDKARGFGGGYETRGGGCSACDICSSLICADCCCECMGGDLIPCC